MIDEMESKMIPKGRIDLIGFGRLGLRTGINLIQVHRGGPVEIGAFDGQKISGSDIIFTLMGAKEGDYKTDFFKQICTHDKDYRKIISIPEYVNEDNLDLIKGDVVVIEIAGGNTIPTAASIIKHVHSYGGKTIGTAGIFGIGDTEVTAKDISEFDDSNPAVNELRAAGITENHTIVTTNKFIRDMEPVTPYMLDKVAEKITEISLRELNDIYD
ncbi:MAG: hypothetical protein Q4P18_02615 [Methanobrevibacter sp.]|uniref:hypothetical protein n=1 Tax=Methanobrevibacter sp. TaxID=66852 RepID=UPI0026E10277|nr:hypothetical protein [Methanobrevibacter sp.]MDO5848405.1 hypothetical protein [Methanobrevibacter sp.]